ncbi:Bcl2-Associated Agonist Of Cell Death [Manis pentadactyla]|nr:Bcl2-Associated Agonist Of Cell Death [Manis pentadactyla]
MIQPFLLGFLCHVSGAGTLEGPIVPGVDRQGLVKAICGAGAVETRSRHSSYPAGAEENEEEEEPSPFRGRSRSAPPNLYAAQRYGRELRRMSDEFQGSIKGLPRPKSAGTATQMRQSPSWTRIIQSWWDRNLWRGGSSPSQ